MLNHNLKRARIQAGMTLDDVAQKVGVSRQTIQRYESGVIQNIPSDNIEKIADILNVSPGMLMGWEAPTFSVAEEIAPYGKNLTEADLNKMLTSGGVLMFGDKKLTEEQKKVLLSVAAAMVKEDSDA